MILRRKNIVLLCFFLGASFGCKQNQDLAPIPTELNRPVSGIEITNVGAGDLGALQKPAAREGATLKEEIVTNLKAKGVAPVRLSVRGQGTWKSKEGALIFDGPQPVIQPENQRIREGLLARMAKAQTPETMPLGPLAMLDKDATGNKASFPLMSGAKLEGVELVGSWSCERAQGQGPAGWKATTLSCTLEQAKAVQTLSNKHGKKRMEGTFLGVLGVTRLNAKDGSIQGQELKMELFLGVEEPSALRLSSSYQASWCASKEACSELGW